MPLATSWKYTVPTRFVEMSVVLAVASKTVRMSVIAKLSPSSSLAAAELTL